MTQFIPMLAGKVPADLTKLRFPLLASPKLDGIRCLIINERAFSRNIKPIPNAIISDMLAGLPPMDGELIVGEPTARDVFQKTSSGVMSVEGAPKFKFFVFDALTRQPMPFSERLALARSYAGSSGKFVMPVPHKLVKNTEELLDYEAQVLLQGYEGVMLRDPNGPYKQGRSTTREGWLLKLKRFQDSEATIIGFTEMEHNDNEQQRDELGRAKRSSAKAGKRGSGVLGAFQAKDVVTGVELSIGSGYTAAQRAEYWRDRASLVGRIVKYRFQPTGMKDAPRFPTFLGFRDSRDM